MRSPRTNRQHGAATLVVVMVLFFIMAMMAAVANRNLVFEQRIASNYYRSGLALETADAGAEWALEALNGGNIDGTCTPSANAASSYRQRYLNFAADGSIGIQADADIAVDQSSSACVNSAAAGLQCQCPSDGVLTVPAIANAAQMQPMFVIQFLPVARPGVVRLKVMGCTDLDSNCRSTAFATNAGLARSNVEMHAALVSALKVPPASPLTVRGDADLGVVGLGLHNTDPALSGLLMQAGGVYSGSPGRATSTAGTPVRDALIVQDPSLAGATPEGMFRQFFGMLPETYRAQPAARTVNCAADCAAALQSAFAAGTRVLWVEGAATISSNLTLGSAADPVLLIVNGTLTLDGPMLLNGLIHARGDVSWNNSTGLPAVITGALMSEGQMTAQGLVDINYSAAIINILSKQRGSFVRVPGSWKENL